MLSLYFQQINRPNYKEIKLVCSYIHEAFISDPNLAKLVHFQVTLELLLICLKFVIRHLLSLAGLA